MKFKLHIVFLLCSGFAWSQSILEQEYPWIDSARTETNAYKDIFQLETDTNKRKNSNFCVGFSPNLIAAYQHDEFVTTSGIKLMLNSNFKKIRIRGLYQVGYANTGTQIYEAILQSKAYFTKEFKKQQSIYNDIRARISYKPNSIFELQTGMDRHFLGEGDRSLLSGNQGISSPFVLARAKFWKFEYQTLHQVWREGIPQHFVPKGNSSHYLNFIANKHFSIGLFETVTHLIKDTLYNRGFDLEYLNPLVFYRPQEYSLGSADNVMLGINTHVSWNKSMLYGQFVLDEFLLSELKARNRWWANKFGIQVGYKVWTKINSKMVFMRTELNLVRPFTYAHVNSNLNYANQGLPVAHPLGSNFVESYSELAFEHKKWNFHLWVQAYLKGIDSTASGFSYGGDVYQSYLNKPTNQEYNYYIGSGTKVQTMQFGCQISRELVKQTIQWFIEPRIYVTNTNGAMQTNPFLTVGIHSNFGADKRNY